MRHLQPLFLSLIILSFCSSCQENKISITQKEQLRGSINTIIEKRYEVEEFENTYNETFLFRNVISFSPEGNRVKEVFKSPNSKWTHVYEYNDNKQCIHEDIYADYDLFQSITHSYNEKGELVADQISELKEDTETFEPSGTINYKYDNQACTESLFSEKGELLAKTVHCYKDGVKIKEILFAPNGKEEKATTLQYNKMKNVSIRSVCDSLSREEIAYEYKYDDKMNWIERKSIKNDQVTEIASRQITYYK